MTLSEDGSSNNDQMCFIKVTLICFVGTETSAEIAVAPFCNLSTLNDRSENLLLLLFREGLFIFLRSEVYSMQRSIAFLVF